MLLLLIVTRLTTVRLQHTKLWLLHRNHLIAPGKVISTTVQKLADIAKQI